MNRRVLISLLGGAAVARPFAAHAQSDGMRRIGVLMALAETDPQAQARVGAFRDALKKLGWTEGRNLKFDFRWGAPDPLRRMPALAAELVALKPDVMLAAAPPALKALQQATRTIPIVFAQVPDPVGTGFVASLARPGGNITGFTIFEYQIGVKWLELLMQIAPRVKRVAVLHLPNTPTLAEYIRQIESVAPTFHVELSTLPARNADEIERGVEAFAREPNGGMVVIPSPLTTTRRGQIVALAMRHRLPAVYPYRYFVTSGGLASYGVDNIDLYRRAAPYVDRILKGEQPANLPVQQPNKFELVINLKTAKALGLDVPITLLARTDQVIE
jgi:putative ABC transport system substrate-binding protein